MADGKSATADPFVLTCRHPDYQERRVDFSEIARGAPDQISGRGASNWLGGFRGRPALARELSPALDLLAGSCKPTHIQHRIVSFRGFWRMLDQLERDGLAPVDTLADLSMFHGTQWLRWKSPPPPTDYASVKAILEVARELAGLEPLDWMPCKQTRPKLGDVATPEQAHHVYLALKKRVYAAYAQWRDADLLAQKGRNLLDLPPNKRLPPSHVNIADLHASYRALSTRSGNPTPSRQVFIEALGYSAFRRDGSPRPLSDVFFKCRGTVQDLSDGLYPSFATIQHFFYLFLIQTGWNVQVALDLDVSNPNWAVKIGDPNADIYRISSFKVRSGTWQRTISRGKPSHSPYQLICRLIERTRPLREGVLQGRAHCDLPTIARRSPWLHAIGTVAVDVAILNEKSYIHDTKGNASYLTALAREVNEEIRARSQATNASEEGVENSTHCLIPENIKASDFRDIYIGNEFLQSGYNLVIAKLAAGHVNMSTIRRYLATRAWRRHSEGSVRRLMDHFWGEVETHRICDPAILRALCDRGTITDEQRERWATGKDRTYLGMGCVNPRNPPKHIDPTHRPGRICRNQHRCTLCEHGIVFPDSLRDLCKRLAELDAIKMQMALAVWDRSDDLKAERVKLVRTLNQFDPIAVADGVAHWKAEIEHGRHHILEWDGLHEC